MRFLKILIPFFLTSCSSQISTRAQVSNQSALEEIRIALLDVRQAFNKQQMDIELLGEKINKGKPTAQINSKDLESRMRHIEKLQEKIQSDLHQLSTHANQTTESLLQFRNSIQGLEKQFNSQQDRLNEVVKLKSTLSSISQAMGNPTFKGKIHKVHTGDTLEKIARQYNTSIEAIKTFNQLSSNTIFINQELKIPE